MATTRRHLHVLPRRRCTHVNVRHLSLAPCIMCLSMATHPAHRHRVMAIPTTPSTSNGAAIVVATGSTGSARSSLASQRSANGGGVTPQPTLTNGHHSPVLISLQTNGFAPPHTNGGGQQSHD
ncbi:unnamed protein product [Sphagnum balticum]